MNILLINQPLNNRGDEAAHKSLMRMLNTEFKNSKFTILFVGANQNSIDQFKVENKSNKYINIPMFRGYGKFIKFCLTYNFLSPLLFLHPTTRKIIKIIRSAEYVVNAPGGVCLGPYQSWLHLYLLKITIHLKKKLAYYSRSFGPFPLNARSEKAFKREAEKVLNKMDFISLRDTVSQRYADEMSLKYIKSIDTALLDVPQAIIPLELKKDLEQPYIVFVPNSLVWHPKFKNISINTIKNFYIEVFHIIEKSYPEANVIMLPQLFNVGERRDVLFFQELAKEIGNPRIKVLDDGYSSDIQQAIIRNAKLVIGSRYHSIVFAINNSTPFVALSYEHKISGLLEILGLEKCLFDLSFLNNYRDENEFNDNLRIIEEIVKNNFYSDEILRAKQNEAYLIAKECKTQFVEIVKNN